ncbi:hypothetical protein EDD86DRAFT_117795 [Gorgonomyces haynaldii]|nr:hypothetical protein EDD86DRAFT_117795 [Gorgonomyces haynaldii]
MDYYEILGLNPDCSSDEIKKQYRQKALALHPDKNRDRDTTQEFSLLQEAYETLSDPNERAWYDRNRDKIINRGPTIVTEASDLMRYFGRLDGDFYTIFTDLFQKLELEERDSYENDLEALVDMFQPESTQFGNKASDYEPSVKQFYDKWTQFTTCKSFRWRDKYQTFDIDDRRIRRLAEQENKKERETHRKEFNETVRKLAQMVKKRDPRFKKHQERLKESQELAKRRQQELKEEEKRRKAEKMKAFVESDWTKVQLEEQEMEEEEVYVDEFECLVCNKIFKSQGQFDAHQRSKKHLDRVKRVRQSMMQDTLTLDDPTDFPVVDPSKFPVVDSLQFPIVDSADIQVADVAISEVADATISEEVDPVKSVTDNLQTVSLDTREEEEFKLDISSADEKPTKQKKKKKEKKEKPKERCNVCKQGFPSRTKLFEHIKSSGHARAI